MLRLLVLCGAACVYASRVPPEMRLRGKAASNVFDSSGNGYMDTRPEDSNYPPKAFRPRMSTYDMEFSPDRFGRPMPPKASSATVSDGEDLLDIPQLAGSSAEDTRGIGAPFYGPMDLSDQWYLPNQYGPEAVPMDWGEPMEPQIALPEGVPNKDPEIRSLVRNVKKELVKIGEVSPETNLAYGYNFDPVDGKHEWTFDTGSIMLF